jgi:endonuclease/exonuclease/phosphatase family metal-dependent hydrolase
VRQGFFVFISVLLFATDVYSSQCADTTVRIMTWNLLNFPSQSNLITDTSTRLPCYRTVVQQVNPDIIVTQENSASNSITFFLNSVLNINTNQYSAGTFINGYDTDNGIFYRTSCFRFVSNSPIQTALRDVNHFVLVHIPTSDTIHIFSCHLKASSGSANESLRASEVDSIRKVTNAFVNGTDFIICGDFNIYGSYEPAYNNLVASDSVTDGQFVDPLMAPGVWNNPAYSYFHTQSPRTRSFGGGATGGLDDRFDMILFSSSVAAPGRITYQSGSTTPVGNDGLHYGDSINRPPNAVVSQQVADALHCASDHLPVYADFNFSVPIGIAKLQKENFQLKVFPNPSGSGTSIGFSLMKESKMTISIYDQLARPVKAFREKNFSAGFHEIKIAVEGELRKGNYMVRLSAGKEEICYSLFTVE